MQTKKMVEDSFCALLVVILAPPNNRSCDQKPSLIVMKFAGLRGLIDIARN